MIVLVTALACEAAPLCRRFGLERVEGRGPRMFLGGEPSMALVVGSVGRERTSAAVEWAKGAVGKKEPVGWLNVGVAGHSSLDVGSVCLVDRVVHSETGRSAYPTPLSGTGLQSDTLYTVDEPELAYERLGLYDMEGSAFCCAAANGTAVELVQLVKVVSDNPQSPASPLDADSISRLVADASASVAAVVEALTLRLTSIAARSEAADAVARLIGDRRLSVTRRRQVRRLLERHLALTGRLPADLPGRDAAQVVAALESRVERAATAAVAGVGRGAPR